MSTEREIRELALDHAVRWGYADRIKPGPEGVVAAAEMFATFLRASEVEAPRMFAEATDDWELAQRLRRIVRMRGGNVQAALGSDIPSNF